MKENQHIEYKESWRDEYLKWICGFANAEGGVLIIGRNDKGVVTGLTDAEKLLEDIPNKVRDVLGIMVKVNLHEQARKEYLDIVVEPYPYPVSYKGQYHYRSGSTKQELKGAALDKFLLREALVNTIIHKDYASGIPVQISVYDNKLMMWNPGQLPPDWSLDRLLAKHASQPANPDIANAFFRAGKIESWGRGIDLIRNTCLEQESPSPRFNCDSNGLWIEFPYSKSVSDSVIPASIKTVGKTVQKTTQKTTQKITQKILAMLAVNPMFSRREIAKSLGDISENGVKYHLEKLKASGHIRRIGPDKGGHWEVLK